MHKCLENPEELKLHLIHRLDALLGEMYVIVASPTEQQRIRGHCDEIEMLLITLFDMTMKEIDLIEAKAWQERKYFVGKHGGYCLTNDGEENYQWLKDHEHVDPDKLNFRLSDNGIGDERARKAEEDFRKWISESGIEDAHWLRDAGVRLPRLSEDWDDDKTGAEDDGNEA